MNDPTQPRVLMVGDPSAGERFVIFTVDLFPQLFRAWPPSPQTAADLQRALEAAALSEASIREKLAQLGLSPEAIDDQVARARRMHAVQTQFPSVFERVTEIGYRNNEGQEVIRKTALHGSVPGQRVFVLRCGRCGREHECDGCDIVHRRCPACAATGDS